MATVLGPVPLDQINARARKVEFGRVVLTLIAAVLYGIGWAAYKVCAVTWFAVAWCGVALKVGWTEARDGGARGPS